jgi:hypothetical protein
MKHLSLTIAVMALLASCDTTKKTASTTLTGGDYRITTEVPWENSLAALAPGENSNALLGQIILSGGQNASSIYTKPLFGPGSPAKLDSAANATTRTLPTTPQDAFGTDNVIVKLKDGSLLAMRNASIWSPMKNPPAWAADSIEGLGIHKGQRGASTFWRSTNGGISWSKQAIIDFGDESLRKYAIPRPMDKADNADVPLDSQATMPNGRKRWWIGGGDRPEVYVCPYTNNIWHTTRVISGIPNQNQQNTYLLFLSTDNGKNWKLIKEDIPAWESLVMTSTPNGRLFLLQEQKETPVIMWTKLNTSGGFTFKSFAVSAFANNKPVPTQKADTVSFNRPGVGNPSICRARTGPVGNDAVLVAYETRNQWNNQEYQILNVQITDEDAAPLVIPITTIKAADPKTHSVMHGTFIQPDIHVVPAASASARSLFYWIEAPRKASGKSAVKYSIFTSAQFTQPKFLSLKSNGQPRFLSSNLPIGDYMKGAFFWYDNKYNFIAHWAEFDGIHCNVVSVPAK